MASYMMVQIPDLVTQAISDRMLTLGVSDLTSYLMLLSGPRRNSELRNLADLVTVRETRFFEAEACLRR